MPEATVVDARRFFEKAIADVSATTRVTLRHNRRPAPQRLSFTELHWQQRPLQQYQHRLQQQQLQREAAASNRSEPNCGGGGNDVDEAADACGREESPLVVDASDDGEGAGAAVVRERVPFDVAVDDYDETLKLSAETEIDDDEAEAAAEVRECHAAKDADGGDGDSDGGDVWGLRITGGSEFCMPITVFHVTEGGQAQLAGIELGDSIVRIADQSTEGMSLAEAQQRIDGAEGDLKLAVKKDVEEAVGGGGSEAGAEQEVLLGRRPQAVLSADRAGYMPPGGKQAWHPVMWQQPPYQERDTPTGGEAPHKRLIRNLHRFFKETENNPESRQRHIEDMLLALPTISKDEN